MQFPYPSCPLEILTKYINKKCIEKGLKCMEPDPKNIPGHTINYREVRIMNGDEMPANWYKLLPESVEIHYRNPEMEHSTYTLTGSINHIEHHHGINDFHLNTTIEDRVALAKDAIHKCTFHLVCHIHDPEYLYHFKPWDANKAKEETTFVIEKKIALPTCKYTSSFQEHKDEKTCNSKEKIFHIIHEEKLCVIIDSILKDVLELPYYEQPVRDIDYRRTDMEYVLKEDSKNVAGDLEHHEKGSK